MKNKKDLMFSLICGFLSALFLAFIILNPKIKEFEKFPFFKKYFWIFFFLLPPIFAFGIQIASFFLSFFPFLFQLAKFVEVGILNTLIDVGTLNFLSTVTGITRGLKIIPLNAISFLLAATNSYFLNKAWTFNIGIKIVKKEFIVFLIVSLIGLFINSAIVFLGTTFISYFKISVGALMNLVKIFATLIVMFWNFFGYKIFVFKK
jgi:putative flippase GtrA